jgi:hypothetical protein
MIKNDVPWSDCKIAFGVHDGDSIWDLYDTQIKPYISEKWELWGTDGSGARWVVIFRVNGIPTREEGEKVKSILEKINKKAEQKSQRWKKKRD